MTDAGPLVRGRSRVRKERKAARVCRVKVRVGVCIEGRTRELVCWEAGWMSSWSRVSFAPAAFTLSLLRPLSLPLVSSSVRII